MSEKQSSFAYWCYYLVASISKPDLGLGTYFQRNYREGQRIEICGLTDWGWDLPRHVYGDWGVSPSRKHKKTGKPKEWNSDEKKEFEQEFARTTIKTQGRLKGQDLRLPSEWIKWKNHRLKKRKFYLSSDPPKRRYKTEEAPPRLVLRENPYPSPNLSSLKPEQGFPSPGHLEFKIWLQHKIEDVAQGRASARFLHLEGRSKESSESESKREELTKEIRDILAKELLTTDPKKKLSDEVNHILLMQKIIGRKTNTFNPTDPYFHKKMNTEQFLQFQAQAKTPNLLDNISRQIVTLLIGKSKTTIPSRRVVYRRVVRSGNFPRLLHYAKSTAINPDTKHKAKIDITPGQIDELIEDDPTFIKWNKFNSQEFAKVIWARNERNPYHSETVPELKRRLDKLSLKKGGNRDKLLSRLFEHEYRNRIQSNLIIDELDKQKIEPPEKWRYAEVSVPAITFFESLNLMAEKEILESLKEVKGIAKNPNDEFELRKDPPPKGTGLTVGENESLERLLLPMKWDAYAQEYAQVEKKGCFGSWNWPQKKTSTKETKTPEEATRHNTRKLIYNIIIILMQKDYIKFQPMTDDDYRKHFPKSNNTKGHLSRGKKAKVHAIHFTKKLRDLIGKSEYRDFKDKEEHPIYRVLRGASVRWMYSPPQRHRIDNAQTGARPLLQAGGLLIKKDRSITTSSNRDYEKMIPDATPRCVANREILDAMNTLQETQWEINLHLLQALFDVKLEGAENAGGGLLSNHPVCDWANKKEQLIDNISPKPIFRNVFSGADDAEEKREKEEMLGWVKRIIDHNANVFWHAWEIDFRGRLFAKCARLSPQSDDFSKAMIRFKHWKPLGKEKQDHTGIDWIHIHVHAFMEGIEIDADESDLPWFRGEKAEKKQTFTTRKKWVQDNLGRLREMAKYPNKFRNTLGLKEKSPEGDDVYQRLAALLELDRAHTEYEGNGQDWSKVYSGHPIYLDATCNGYQHASTLLGNRNLAELVNVVGKPGDNPRDLYAEVAKAALEVSDAKQMTVPQLNKFAKKHGLSGYSNLKKAELLDALYNDIPLLESAGKIRDYLGDFLNEDQLNIALERIFSRTVAKKPTMTSAYGAKDLRGSFEERGGDGDKLHWTVKKTQKEIEDDKIKLVDLEETKNIDPKYRKLYLRMKKSTTPYSERAVLRSKLQKMKANKGLSENKYKDYTNWIIDTKQRNIWHEGSSLAVALLEQRQLWGDRNKKQQGFLIHGQSKHRPPSYLGKEDTLTPDVREVMDKRARRQHDLTNLVVQAYKDAIKFVTKDAMKVIQDDLKRVAEDGVKEDVAPKATSSKGDGLWPGVQWHLPQDKEKGFRINHYSIARPDPSSTRKGNPCRPRSVFNNRLPDWYTVKNYKGMKDNDKKQSRILQRLDELYGIDPKVSKPLKSHIGKNKSVRELKELAKEHELSGYSNLKKAELVDALYDVIPNPEARRTIVEILEIVDPQKIDSNAEEIRTILRFPNISRNTYDKDEWKRIEYHKGRVANEKRKLYGTTKPTDEELKKLITDHHKLTSSLLPNFIHSLDAYHMRKTVNQCAREIDHLSFWSVHDAFGTHACDVGDLVRIVKDTFYDIHKPDNLEFNGWIKGPADLPKMKAPELKKLAKKHGLSGYSNLRKAELLAALDKVIPLIKLPEIRKSEYIVD